VALAAAVVSIVLSTQNDDGPSSASTPSTSPRAPTASTAAGDDSEARARLAGLAVQNAQLQSQVAEQAAALASQQAQIDQLEATPTPTTATPATTAAPVAPAPAPFSVAAEGVLPSASPFRGTIALQECVGFADDCATTFTTSPSFVRDGDQLVLDVPTQGRVSLTTVDGLNYTGQGPTSDEGAFTCGDKPSPTTLAVQLSPVRFSVNPATSAVTVTGYNATFTKSTPGAGCTAAHYSYAGTIATTDAP
jgi:hypothetical protein